MPSWLRYIGHVVFWLIYTAASAILALAVFTPTVKFDIAPTSIIENGGYAYFWSISDRFALAFSSPDTVGYGQTSELKIQENGHDLPRPHSMHDEIRQQGQGRFSHWTNGVHFSTLDSSDPRTNGRAYAAVVPLRPPLETVAASLAFVLLLPSWWITIAVFRPQGPLPRAQIIGVSGGIVLILFGAAILASLSQTGLYRVNTIIPTKNVAAVTVQGVSGYQIDIDRIHGPFLIFTACESAEIRIGKIQTEYVPYCDRPKAFIDDQLWTSGNDVVFDIGDYMFVKSDSLTESDSILLRRSVKADQALVLMLWMLSFALAVGLVLFAHFSQISLASGLSFLAGAPVAAISVVLLMINATGLFLPLRAKELQPGNNIVEALSYGSGDLRLSFREARKAARRMPGELNERYATRLTGVVADSVAHIWWSTETTRFRIRVPIWESYLLWAVGGAQRRFALYLFVDPDKALERGVGLCSQVSLILTQYLRREGVDARVVQLNGHTIVTAQVEAGRWILLDPDFNVVIPRSLSEVERNPDLVRKDYRQAFDNIGVPAWMLDSVVMSFNPEGNTIDYAGVLSAVGDTQIELERLAYSLKWRMPIALLLTSVVLTLVGLYTIRRSTASLNSVHLESEATVSRRSDAKR